VWTPLLIPYRWDPSSSQGYPPKLQQLQSKGSVCTSTKYWCVTLCYFVLPCVTLCYSVLPNVTLCDSQPVLPHVTPCYLELLCITLCYPVFPHVPVCSPVLPALLCVTLCYSVLPVLL